MSEDATDYTAEHEPSPEYARTYMALTWDTLPWEDRLAFILGCEDAEEWYTPTALTVLGYFRHVPHVWGRIKARGLKLRIYGKELEASVDSWLHLNPSANGVPPPAPPSPATRRGLATLVATEPWREVLVYNAQGDPKQTAANISLLLAHHPAWQGQLWWDDVRGRAMVGALPLSDELITEVMVWLQTAERLPTTLHKLVERCVVAECRKHPRDLLQEWLFALPPWDTTPRLDEWLADIAAAPRTAYGFAVARILPLSMVARAMDPGCLYRYVVILEGPEEYRKSTLVRELGGAEWYVPLSIGLESKESHMMLQGAWVAEMPELDSLTRTEETRLKAFITFKEDSYIPKYSNFRVTTPRRTIFVGTTNEESYLKGQTGNTRFLPIRLETEVALEDFLAIREQLFAEALAWYQAHPDTWWQLPEDAAAEARQAREERRVVNVYEPELGSWLEQRRLDVPLWTDEDGAYFATAHETTWLEIARGFLKMDSPERWKDIVLQKQIASALKALGWVQTPRWDPVTQKTRRIWCQPRGGPP